MSYKTVTDINLSSQINYQINDLVKSKESYSSSKTSFDDLVSFYKQKDKLQDSNSSDSKIEKENVNNNDSVDSKKVGKSETNKTDADSPKKSDNSEELSKSEINNEADNVKESDSKLESDNSEKKVEYSVIENDENHFSQKVKKDNENLKEKKLSEKDFARLNHIIDENALAVKVEETELSPELKEKETEKKLNAAENDIVLQGNERTVAVNQFQNMEKQNAHSGKNDESKDFGLFSKSDKNEKIFLDKENKIEVQDLRSQQGKIADLVAENEPKMKVSEPKLLNENTVQITMELNQNVNSNVISNNSQTAAANGSNFQAMLNNQIQQSAPEFVKAGNLILKDNNQGTINLVLRPDDLGDVKLHLSLDGKNISGHITVATKEALEVFKDNAETLREAFIKNGFDSANFDVSYGGNQSGFNQEMAFEQQNDGSELFARKVYSGESLIEEENQNLISENIDEKGNYSINIVA